jgi:hypothetical protein
MGVGLIGAGPVVCFGYYAGYVDGNSGRQAEAFVFLVCWVGGGFIGRWFFFI